ncbi:MAG: DNA/RNA nuclease SfsA [Methanomassiliicoccales archaeon]|jgi:sugar fermentation stimulation protein A
MSVEKYIFSDVLAEGLIISRPNRFIMNVLIDGEMRRCHCPTTGRIGDVIFKNVPCLVEKSNDLKRSTWGTVEAVSLDPPEKEQKSWIGIDQGRANDIVAFFIGSGQLENMVGSVKTVNREVKMGDSRIDFLINDEILLEVKTPLHMLMVKGYPEHSSTEGFTSFERTMRHFTEISEHIPEGKRGIVLLCHIFDAPRFQVPQANGKMAEEMKSAVRRATAKGVENWQVNFELDQNGVELLD